MSYLNKVILIGNVGQEPVIRSTSSGKEIMSLTIATSEFWKDKATGEKKEKTEWHKISIFNENLVSLVKSYVKKGSKLYIEGSLQTKKYVDNSGVEKYTTEIVLQNYSGALIMLDSKDKKTLDMPNIPESFAKNSESFASSDFATELDDEIPF
jgi:single-strand DNA-binding protein